MAPLRNSDGERGKRFVPADEDSRRVIAEQLDETLFVEASAGTGKTASLVARLVSLVRTGRTTLDRIAAITFTETAAAELRDRVRQGLEEAAADASLGEEARARCAQGTVDLDQASIQTLHSFASALLHDRPLEAGLPPAFETSDEIAAGLRFDEAWTEWIDAALEEDSPARAASWPGAHARRHPAAAQAGGPGVSPQLYRPRRARPGFAASHA